jgi:anthranilate synthase component 1
VSGPAAQRSDAAARLAAGRPAALVRRLIADTETPVGAAARLIEPGRGDFLLESVEGGEVRGRYSLLGLDPDLVFRAEDGEALINPRWAQDRDAFAPSGEGPLETLRRLAGECRIDLPEGLPPLACLVGYFGYETIGLVEELPRAAPSPLGLPDMLFVRPRLIMVFDRLGDELTVVAPLWPGTDVEHAIAGAEERMDSALRRLAEPVPPPARTAPAGPPALTPVLPPGRYGEMVSAAKEYIAAGDVFQVVLAQRFTAPFALPAFQLYRALRRINPSPFLFSSTSRVSR